MIKNIIVLLATISALIAIASGKNAPKFGRMDISGQVVKSVQCIQQRLRHAIPGPGQNIPSFNPLKLRNLNLDPKNGLFHGFIGLVNVVLAGITEFEPKIKANLQIFPMKVNVDFDVMLKKISLETDYDLFVTAFHFLDIFGGGHLSTKINNLRINGTVQVTLGRKVDIAIKCLKITLARAKVVITGLAYDNNISAITSGVISNVASHFFELFADEINVFALKIAKKIVKQINIIKLMEIFGDCIHIFPSELLQRLEIKNVTSSHPKLSIKINDTKHT